MTPLATSAALSEAELAVDVLLRNGGIAQLRPVQPFDEAALHALNARVSIRTRVRRYFSVSDRPGEWYVDKLMHSTQNGDALVAVVGGQIVALASFARLERDPSAGDLALLVDDDHQSEGLGALLLEHLAQVARNQGITAFFADVLFDNTPMLHLLAHSGFATRSHVSYGVTEVHIDLGDRPELRTAIHLRENAAEQASLQPLLAPRSVAVVGSLRPDSVADQAYRALRGRSRSWTGAGAEPGFTGTVYRVDSHGTLADVPESVDLVVVAVAADRVLDVAREAVTNGAKGLLVLSAGFAEAGAAGVQRQQSLVRICRAGGIRLVGPNCLGIVNTDPAIALNATFCDASPRPGQVGLISQSGAVGIAALRHAERAGVGLSLFVSTGNKADVSGNDLLAYLEDDPRTTVIALYLESFGNARKFAEVAGIVGRTKPIVVVKAGRSVAGARAGLSHTAAAATPETAIGALLHRAGVLRADDLSELFDLLTVLEVAPLPRGPRVAIIGNSGGPGVLAADECASAGLEMAELADATEEQLRALLPSGVSVRNPVDLLSTVTPESYETAVRLLLQDPGVDAVLAIYTPLARGAEELYAAALTRAHADSPNVPLLVAFPGVASSPLQLEDAAQHRMLPFFEFPEPAVRALGKVTTYAAWRSSTPPPGAPAPQGTARSAARALINAVALDDSGEGWLTPQAATSLLEEYGITTARVIEAPDVTAALAAAETLGYPVAVKAAGPTIVHKEELGGVILDIQSADELRVAFTAMEQRVGPAMTSAVVQPMHAAAGAMELIAGITIDPSVGPLVLVGAGGTFTDLLDDRVVRMPPQSLAAAVDQISSLRCAARFGSYRNLPALDLEATAEVLLSLAALTRDLPEIRELDLNPLVVSADGVCVLDVRIRVGPAAAAPEHATRALRQS